VVVPASVPVESCLRLPIRTARTAGSIVPPCLPDPNSDCGWGLPRRVMSASPAAGALPVTTASPNWQTGRGESVLGSSLRLPWEVYLAPARRPSPPFMPPSRPHLSRSSHKARPETEPSSPQHPADTPATTVLDWPELLMIADPKGVQTASRRERKRRSLASVQRPSSPRRPRTRKRCGSCGARETRWPNGRPRAAVALFACVKPRVRARLRHCARPASPQLHHQLA